MRQIVLTAVCFVGWNGVALAGGAEAPLQQKLQSVPKQLLLKQVEQASREATKRVPFVRVEMQGTLSLEISRSFHERQREWWILTAGDFKWELHLGTNEEFLQLAKENKGKAIVVTGWLAMRRDSYSPLSGTTVVNVVTIKAAGK